ncbi:hypothetical protein ACDW34_08660 [Acinetobacter piscicola]|uniref:hypothetical protein n=1 Tax=Acinetobacter piscicola TaxID=2006115 RepID=UPI0035589E4F
MHKLLIVSSLSLFFIACSQPPPDKSQKDEINQPNNKVEVNVESSITPEQAKAFGENLYKKIEHDEPLIDSAFKAKNQVLLKQYENDFQVFANTPYGEIESKKQLGQRYFPSDPIAEPYVLCDRALNSLYTELSSMQSVLREDTQYMRDSLKEKKEYYQKTKAECKTIIDMDYDSAVAEYEKYI